MAVNTVTFPEDYRPVYNPIEWVFNSDNADKCDFVYIADIYVNTTFAIRLKAFPDSPNGYGHFRIERVLQDFLSNNFDPEVITFTQNPSAICEYQIKVYERYNTSVDCTGNPTLSSLMLTTTKKFAWNGALQYHEQPAYIFGKYDLINISSKFLTASPEKVNIDIDDFFTMKFIQNAGNVKDMCIKTYGPYGILATVIKTNPFYNSTVTAHQMLTAPVGPKNIASFVTLSGVERYTVYMRDNAGTRISELKTFYIKPRCTKYKKYRLWWLNPLGGYDAATFDLKSIRRLDIARDSFNKLLASDYSVGARGETVTSVDARSSYNLNSDWIREEDALWYEDLFTSPDVFMYERIKKYVRNVIVNVTCPCPPAFFPITGAAYNAGTVNLYINDASVGAGGIVTGTYFAYSGTGFSAMGAPNSGTHKQITGYDVGGAFYTTNIVATTNVGTIITGSVQTENNCKAKFEMEEGFVPVSFDFDYVVQGGNSIGMLNSGSGSFTGFSSGSYDTNVPCLAPGGIVYGSIKSLSEVITKIPVVVASTQYEEKIKANIRNIKYDIDLRPSYRKNVQGS